MNYLPLVAFAVIIILFLVYAGRARRKQQAARAALVERIDVGTEVMTTSGLYATVAAKHADGTVQLSIAAGVDVRWELAALRDVASLPRTLEQRPDAVTGPGDTASVDLEKDDSGNRGDAR